MKTHPLPLTGSFTEGNNQINKEFVKICEGIKILQIPNVQEELGKEMEILHELGVDCYEIEFLVDLKIKEEFIMQN